MIIFQLCILVSIIPPSHESFKFLAPWLQNLATVEINESIPGMMTQNDGFGNEKPVEDLEPSRFPEGICILLIKLRQSASICINLRQSV